MTNNNRCEPFTKEEIKDMLKQAKLAYHELMMGKAEVEVRDQNNEMIKYNRMNAKDLLAYIEYLEELLGCRKVLRPLEFFF